jgi:acyl-CoA synthetase (NDP forming)/GNAT superfamily N-acetyltransferase
MVQERPPVYALLADGTTVEIRPAVPGDFDAVKAMHEAMSPGNSYMRFFNISRLSAEIEARRICGNPAPGSAALLALRDGEVVGVASYVLLKEDPHTAEVAFAVADHMHHRGIATLLLEHLVSLARSRQITTFTAETLTDNEAMLGVFADAGLPVRRRYREGVIELIFPLPGQDGQDQDSYLNAVAERERRADVASLRHIFAPESVAVIGASRRRGTVGRAILDNIRAAGYAGRLYTVNPRARQVGAEPCLASAHDLPEPADLAVIAVPAAAVLEVAAQCGQRGVRSVVVITSGLDAARSAELLSVCRSHGMRLVGPDCFGVAVPSLGLDATFAARPARAGVTGLVMQSGGLGFALVDHLSRLGIGISSFASVGDKLDVSGNDMLLWWERDDLTRLAVLYIESFGNPRQFARTARRVSCAMPVLTVLTDTVLAGLGAFQETLFSQAGVITTRGFGELIQVTALLATQPVPAGRTVAIVSNVRSAGQLAADAGAGLGLSVRGPVGTPAPVSAEVFRQCLAQLAADDEVDAVVAIVLPTGATGDLEAAIREATTGKPLAAVVLTQPESVRLIDNRIPAYGSPEAAVRAVAAAAGYGAWRAAPRGHVPALPDVRTADARALVQAPGWLGPAQAAELLRCYGIPLADPASGGLGGDQGFVPPGTGGAPPGPRVAVRVAGDRVFGPLVKLEAGDSYRTARFTPLTDVDAAYLTSRDRTRPDLDVLHDLLLRVSRLADDLPEVTELDLDLGGAAVINARVKVEPYQPQDPYLRRLR